MWLFRSGVLEVVVGLWVVVDILLWVAMSMCRVCSCVEWFWSGIVPLLWWCRMSLYVVVVIVQCCRNVFRCVSCGTCKWMLSILVSGSGRCRVCVLVAVAGIVWKVLLVMVVCLDVALCAVVVCWFAAC